jgi:hypothetical protein
LEGLSRTRRRSHRFQSVELARVESFLTEMKRFAERERTIDHPPLKVVN